MTSEQERALAMLRERVRQWMLDGPPTELPEEGELLARIFVGGEPAP